MNTKYQVLTPSGWSNFHGIRRKFSNNVVEIYSSNNHLTCTHDHLIKTNKGFVQANDLINTDVILKEEVCKNISINVVQDQYVYDLVEVELNNEYYTNSFISHNCGWLGSSGTLISGATLKSLVAKTPYKTKPEIKQYYAPAPGRSYVIVADVSRGKGLDYSAAQIIDVTTMPYEQVCTYRSNLVTPVEYSRELYLLSKMYNNATLLIEVNDIGGQVADILYYDYESENLICTESAGARGKRISSGASKTADKGIRTTKTVKNVGCSILKLLIEQQQLIINDHDTIHELSRFSRKGVSYEAEKGCNDDLVMGLVLFAWLSDQQFFKELTDIHTLMKLRDKSDEDIENDLVPFGHIIDRSNEGEFEEPMIIDLVENFHELSDAYKKLINDF